MGRLESVCIRVRLAQDFKWALDSVDEDGAPDQGCWWRHGQMTSTVYTPLVKADASISLGGVSFLVRSTDDPYIKAQRLTDGSMYALAVPCRAYGLHVLYLEHINVCYRARKSTRAPPSQFACLCTPVFAVQRL